MARKTNSYPIKAVQDIVRPRSWCIYGRSGAGKTTFAGSFPTPILLLDVNDQGTDSVRNVKNLGVWDIDKWEDFDEVLDCLAENPNKYKTLVVDTVTQMQDKCLDWVREKKKKKKLDNIGDWGTLTLREWGDAAAAMKSKITEMRNLPMEVVFIAQEKAPKKGSEDEDDATDDLLVPEVGPNAMKSVAGHLNASVSIIGHSFVKLRRYKETVRGKEVDMEEPVHCLRIGANPVYITKTRKPRTIEVPAYIENAEYKDVLEALEGD